MPSGNTKDKQLDWTEKHTLTERDMRQLILNKVKRAELLQKANANRRLSEFA